MSTPAETNIEKAVIELRTTVAALTITMQAMEKRLHLVYTVVVLVIGAVGGPNAVTAITGH